MGRTIASAAPSLESRRVQPALSSCSSRPQGAQTSSAAAARTSCSPEAQRTAAASAPTPAAKTEVLQRSQVLQRLTDLSLSTNVDLQLREPGAARFLAALQAPAAQLLADAQPGQRVLFTARFGCSYGRRSQAQQVRLSAAGPAVHAQELRLRSWAPLAAWHAPTALSCLLVVLW
jgi:hypothetical protein